MTNALAMLPLIPGASKRGLDLAQDLAATEAKVVKKCLSAVVDDAATAMARKEAAKVIPVLGWRSTNLWNTAANARLLRKNMGDTINAGEDAHHIVASTHERAGAARRLLDKYQIDINDPINGVGLKPTGPKPSHHGCGLHSHDTIDRVTERLRDAVTGVTDWADGRQALIDAITKLKDQIQRGHFP